MPDVRTNLDRIIRERGDDYVSISKMLGRNAAYIQQFIKRGTPRKLDEDDRRTLARYFEVPEVLLGGSEEFAFLSQSMVMVPRLSLGASAGPGANGDDEIANSKFGFESTWLRKIASDPKAVSMIKVAGDSMEPTLADGDDILVDAADNVERVRDGIYVLRVEDALLVKRLAVNPIDRRFVIRSDNSAYPDWNDVDPAQVKIIGRVIWAGHKVH